MSATTDSLRDQVILPWPTWVLPNACVIVFDGVCNFCNRNVQFLLHHERSPELRFAAAQSQTGAALLGYFGLSTSCFDTMVFIENGQAFVKTDAALRLVRYLRRPWQWLRVGWLLPRPWRDGLYDLVAARRYAWFGTREACLVPTPDVAERFFSK